MFVTAPLLQIDISEDAVAKSKDGRVSAAFTYSAVWTETTTPYEKRMDKYRQYQFLPQHLEVCPAQLRPLCLLTCQILAFSLSACCATTSRLEGIVPAGAEFFCTFCRQQKNLQDKLCLCLQIHWFSIINSCVTVLLLTGFLATILMRVLKNDFVKYSRDDDGTCQNVYMHFNRAPHVIPSPWLDVVMHICAVVFCVQKKDITAALPGLQPQGHMSIHIVTGRSALPELLLAMFELLQSSS